jgi:predicted RNA-binding Zn-ribbon protein involved in translation (DUF1610 family)
MRNMDNTWIYIIGDYGMQTCSKCECKIRIKRNFQYKYCPNCGSRMNKKIIIMNQYDYDNGGREKYIR